VGFDPVAHGFTAVDAQPRPGELVGVLDRLTAEPFYEAYKRRLRDLLHAQPGARVLDVGAGPGDNALALAAERGARVVALDQSVTLAAAMRARAVGRVVVADGHRLPFRRACFDGVLADRVLQHVAEPGPVLDQMLRVLRPGGRLALADPDYDTQVLDIEHQELARRVLRFRAEAALRNGALAHRHAGLLAERGLEEITVEARTLVVRDSHAVDNVMGLRTWAHAAAAHGYLQAADAERFVA
jgi:SAM-dependent methyltransferase